LRKVFIDSKYRKRDHSLLQSSLKTYKKTNGDRNEIYKNCEKIIMKDKDYNKTLNHKSKAILLQKNIEELKSRNKREEIYRCTFLYRIETEMNKNRMHLKTLLLLIIKIWSI